MLHARKDYNARVQDRDGIIPAEEPVFLLRAKDRLMLPTLEYYAKLLITLGDETDENTMVSVLRHIQRVAHWRRCHAIKAPDCRKEDLEE